MRKLISALSGMLVFILIVFVTTSTFAEGEPQAAEGFSTKIYASRTVNFSTYRGTKTTSYYEYARKNEYIEWYTDTTPSTYTTGKVTFLWSGLTGPDSGSYHISLNGKRIITFTSGYRQDKTWTSGDYELFFDYRRTISYGSWFRRRYYGAGVYYLTAPADDVIPGEKNRIKIEAGSGSAKYDRAMVYNFTDTLSYEKANGTLNYDHIGRAEEAQKIPPEIESFTADPLTGQAPLEVVFNCVASDSDGTIISYYWDFGDGETDTTVTGQTTHTYDDPNPYSVSVTVKDNDNLTKTAASINITVTAEQEPVNFTIDKTPPEIIITLPQDGALVNTPIITIEGTIDGVPFAEQRSLNEGENTVTKTATDDAGNISLMSITVTLDTKRRKWSRHR